MFTISNAGHILGAFVSYPPKFSPVTSNENLAI
jgi:hypothetical protein